ncbi:MAG: TraB/VirB10 family protein [Pseudoruegeria sp.]
MAVNKDRKNKQVVFAVVAVVAIVGGLFVVTQLTKVEKPNSLQDENSTITSNLIESKTEAASPEMSWITDGRDQLKTLSEHIESLTNAIETIQEKSKKDLDELAAQYDEVFLSQQAEINILKGQGAGQTTDVGQNGTVGDFLTNTRSSAVSSTANGTPLGAPLDASTAGLSQNFQGSGSPLIRSFTLLPRDEEPADLDLGKADTPLRLDSYLPAGSYAPAIVLSGVDASTGVTNSSDPIPVLMRITGSAVTAGERSTKGFRINLTGCTVTGSARGDLSSERVYVRLLKMTCIKPGGNVFERTVSGYMSGAGKAGSRGLVVSREGKLVKNAAIAGVLGGLASGVSSVADAVTLSDSAEIGEVISGAGASAVGGGVENAASQLSDYYIERAEQFQPVVSLYGGTEVEIVFLEGVDLS